MVARDSRLLTRAIELSADAVEATSAISAARAIDRRLVAAGASYVQVRHYARPGGGLTSATHWAAGGFLSRTAPTGWFGSVSCDYICFKHNPLLNVVRDGLTRYRFSELAPRGQRGHGAYWDAFGEADIADGFGANAYAPGGAIASIHVGFPVVDLAPHDLAALRLAAGIAVEAIIGATLPVATMPSPSSATTPVPRLSTREDDAMRYVAEGKTDWEIGMILGISETTARFHVDNARRKLGATNRAHAVARFISGANGGGR